MKMGICSDCNEVKDLTTYGDCFKCHIRGLGIKSKGCTTCKGIEEYRTSQKITVNRTSTPI